MGLSIEVVKELNERIDRATEHLRELRSCEKVVKCETDAITALMKSNGISSHITERHCGAKLIRRHLELQLAPWQKTNWEIHPFDAVVLAQVRTK